MADLFYVFAPCGIIYGPSMTIDEAQVLIAERSFYAGEPGWEIAPEDADLGAIRERIRERNVAEYRKRYAIPDVADEQGG